MDLLNINPALACKFLYNSKEERSVQLPARILSPRVRKQNELWHLTVLVRITTSSADKSAMQGLIMLRMILLAILVMSDPSLYKRICITICITKMLHVADKFYWQKCSIKIKHIYWTKKIFQLTIWLTLWYIGSKYISSKGFIIIVTFTSCQCFITSMLWNTLLQ